MNLRKTAPVVIFSYQFSGMRTDPYKLLSVITCSAPNT
jgi:hypothetical protein